ncbi:Hsp20/alpha crystallin family protein [Adhaeribacter aquaticus]|uniref:Hsp20/alpha crystallin family protein n=1 Tax=Adhaeribacter aquaticus TaxID=299567 RepID=UPI000404D883|nr:Hsp20/alpha crystallin family protein [Adhaeribacter aquaticus]
MNIIKNKKILKGLGHQIDQLNTLNGGISMAQVEVAKKKDKMVVTVKAPSVRPETIQVQVEYNKLFVYATLPQLDDKEQMGINFPMFARIIEIPFHVAAEEIRAVYTEGQLKIIMPYKAERLNGRRSIEIEQL